ncbi:hypothetical protein [Pseudomonas atagonensis]|uniref:hypothetical protein n=1 Tax=Pseudomonas atagonensis TaxID=2609964 RepID=UPI001407F12C|nr:hypothetical protein [Pseudomonas atagonensis]
MNQAVENKLHFGSDLIFTYGPYSSISTEMYHPSTDTKMLWGSGFLGLCFGLVLLLLTFERPVWWKLPLIMAISAGFFTWDALIFFYGVAVGIYCLLNLPKKTGWLIEFFAFSVLMFSLGLLPLIKGTFIIFCVVVVGSITFQALYLRQWMHALISLVFPACGVLFFWGLSGQPLLSLSDYFVSMIPVVATYTEAMSTRGDGLSVFSFVLAVLVLVFAVWKIVGLEFLTKFNLFGLLALVSFLVFKAGFVRHGHEYVSGDFILAVAMLMMVVRCSRYFIVAFVLSVFVWVQVDIGGRTSSVGTLPTNLVSNYKRDWEGLNLRLFQVGGLNRKYEESLVKINRHFKLPDVKGSADIYSFNQVNLLSSGARWNPRPVFQSYAAYNETLAEINKAHLIGANAPENIFFNVEPIDGRLPSLEDGVSWPVLLSKYQPEAYENKFLLLQKKQDDSGFNEVDLRSSREKVGRKVSISANNKLLFAKIYINKTFFGRVVDLLFKPDELAVIVELRGGETKRFRLISSMARSGFVLSPLIQNSLDFGLLYNGTKYLGDKEVIGITVESSHSRQWEDSYLLELSELSMPKSTEVETAFNFVDPSVRKKEFTSQETCEGSIESANGTSLGGFFSASTVLRVDGWITPSITNGLLADEVFVVLTDDGGKDLLLPAKRVYRRDVGEYLASKKLENAGYSTIADVSGLAGNYRLSIAYEYTGKLVRCSNLEIRGHLAGGN